MVRGKPYIAVNRVTRNALNALKLRQSHRFWGLKKLNAKNPKITVLITMRPHSP